MLAFITSLHHPDDVADFAYNDALLARTLGSVSRQSDDDYVIIVVGERAPGFELPPRTEFIPVDFPPRGTSIYKKDKQGTWKNKGTKMGIGLVRARELGAEYAMLFDFDDFVHRDLARFVNAQPGRDGWYISDGWLHSQRRNVVQQTQRLNRRCGTCNIVTLGAYDIPEHLAITATQDQVLEAYGDHIFTIIGRHWQVPDHLADRGIMLERFPFRAAMYNVETGVNTSGNQIFGLVHPLTNRLAHEFGIVPSLGLLGTLRFVVAPRALAQGIAWKLGRLQKRFSRGRS